MEAGPSKAPMKSNPERSTAPVPSTGNLNLKLLL